MKLISCHIENYGKIKGLDLEFDSAFTAFCEENGYGKTTLASFLKAMFYGLDADRANSSFNERRHFYPFAGGRFGGHITFEAEGRIYKIERYFDEKSEKKDALIVYCSGISVPLAEGQPGERFFGIDKASFERTIFISGADIQIASTGSINTRLNHFVAGGDDDANLEKALAQLEKKKKEYKKSRLGNDRITCETNRINRLSERISNLETIRKGLPEKYAALHEVNQSVSRLNGRIAAAQSEGIVRSNWKHYDERMEEIEGIKAKIRQVEERYPFGMPAQEEIGEVQEALERERTLTAKKSIRQFTQEDEARYAALQVKFSGGLPADTKLVEVKKKMETYTELSYDLAALEQEEPAKEEQELMQRFAHRCPGQEEIDMLNQKEERLRAAEEACRKLPDFVISVEYSAAPPRTVKPGIFAGLAVVFAMLALGGIVCMSSALQAGIALIAVGVLGILITGFLYLNKKMNARPEREEHSVQKENPEKMEAKRKADALYAEIQASLASYGYTMEKGTAFAVASFQQDVATFHEQQAKRDAKKAECSAKAEQKQTLTEEIDAFFAGYDMAAGGYGDRLTRLYSDKNAYMDLGERKKKAAEEERELEKELQENRKAIRQFCENYHFSIGRITEQIGEISQDRKDLAALRADRKDREEKAGHFKTENGLLQRPVGQAEDLQELQKALNKAQEEKNRLSGQISDAERDAEGLDSLQDEREEARENLAVYKADYELLEKTVEALKQADQNLKDRYIKPVRDQFLYYADLLEKALGEKVIMNANFEIRYERDGKERSEMHLSAGEKSICALCFRLALIDNMYAKEKPFIILDDPFVNLDEAHMKNVKTLLAGMAEKLQLLYFTCHPSRAL